LGNGVKWFVFRARFLKIVMTGVGDEVKMGWFREAVSGAELDVSQEWR
jgi:hypothetical protein